MRSRRDSDGSRSSLKREQGVENGSGAVQTHWASFLGGKGSENIKAKVGSYRGHDITMLKSKFFVVALFAVIVHASAIGQFSHPPLSDGNTGPGLTRRPGKRYIDCEPCNRNNLACTCLGFGGDDSCRCGQELEECGLVAR